MVVYGGNKVIMKRNCEVEIEDPIIRIHESLQECVFS